MARRALLFVYGSLKRGCANHPLLAGGASAGEATTAAAYALADLGDYPGLLAAGRHAVAGELYLVDGATLTRLDDFEGHPDLFHRRRAELSDGRRAWAYFIRPEVARGCPALAPTPGGTVRWLAEAGQPSPAGGAS